MTMRSPILASLLALVFLAGCAAVIDDGSRKERAPDREDRPVVSPATPAEEPERRRSGSKLSPAAASLLATAEGYLRGGEPDQAISLSQRAHRISPDSAEVYYSLARAHKAKAELSRAEQFALRGVALAGDQEKLEQQGWRLVAEIRQEAGDRAGAEEAASRVSGR